MWELLGVACSWHQHPVTLMLHCGDHRLHTWHNQGFQFQLALCGTYQLHFAVWFLFETCFVLGKLGVVHFNHAHLAKHQCHITVLVNNIYATIFCSDFSLHWIVDTYTVQSMYQCIKSLLSMLKLTVNQPERLALLSR